ncbi:MAG: hypothetical protein HY301_02340 [Verrucomicrobia bacterium]|nr:hypothetical protein [Verrucomicrobiota bacterium]
MNPLTNRRTFLHSTAVTGALLGLGELSFLAQLPRVSAAEAKPDHGAVRFGPDIEPLVRLLEDTSRGKLLEEVATRVKGGLPYRELLAALLLAGVRNIQPRPVGFKFHAVLVVNSAHLASLNSPDSDRWLPIFWALDQFKNSQARNQQEGGWTLAPVDESAVPASDKAKEMFQAAMDNWDEAPADAAVAGLARNASAQECFEIFARLGARDFRDIGHKAIYVANSWRTLQTIGWPHAEPVLRSLAYALLERGGRGNPAKEDLTPDRPWRRNAELAKKIRAEWRGGKADATATAEMLKTLREGSDADASQKVVELLNRGVAVTSLHDAFFQFANELVMKKPGIVALHAVTSTNALHYTFQHTASDDTRRMLLLQNAAFLALFRTAALGDKAKAEPLIEKFEAEAPAAKGEEAIAEIFADASRDRMLATRKALAYLQSGGGAQPFIAAAQRLIYLKGADSHDYKFSSAVLEDYRHTSPAQRDRCLAASLFYLRGSGSPDNSLVKRTREAFKA